MLFVVAGRFKPGAETQRDAIQGQFSEHLMQRGDRVHFGGPLYGEDGARLGVLLLVEAPSFAEAKAFLLASPYQQAGLYETVEVSEIRAEIGALR